MRKKENEMNWSSHMDTRERKHLFAIISLHFLVMPAVCTWLMLQGKIDADEANTLCYAVGLGYVFLFYMDYLRREFDPLCENRRRIFFEILFSYGAMYCFNLITGSIISFAGNPNNNAITDWGEMNFGQMTAVAVIMAPFIEEIIFRAGVFGLIREKNRVAAYVAGTLLFSIYHVYSYAIADPTYWIYILQYIPVSFLLCRVYERTKTIWSSIFFHMAVNMIAILALKALS